MKPAETYKGIEIFHDAVKKEFYTKVLVRVKTSAKTKAHIVHVKIEKVKIAIDVFLKSIYGKKVQKAWLKSHHADGCYKMVDIVFLDPFSKAVTIRDLDLGKIKTIPLSEYEFNDDKVFLCSRKNNTIIAKSNNKQLEINAMKADKLAIMSKLVALKSI